MTRTQIEYILSLAKHKSFGIAAKERFISQSTLSAMIAKFEEQIGIEIFSRKTRPISVTQKGEQIINSLKNINREYLLLDEKIREVNQLEEGQIKLACIPTIANSLFPLTLNPISESFSHVDFNIYELTTENIIAEIKSGNIDIGIVSLPLEDSELTEYHLYDEEFFVYDYGSKRIAKRYKVSDIDLNRLWILEEGHCMRNQIGKLCDLREKKKMNGNLYYNCGSINTLIEMVHHNEGITLLPELAIDKNDSIVKDYIHPIHGITPLREVGIIVHKNFARNRLLRQLIEVIKSKVPLTTKKNKNLTYLRPL